MYLLNPENLLPGDIILTRENTTESKFIRRISNSDYSHAMLYVGNSSCIEADGLGVHSLNIQRKLFKKSDDVFVLRLEKKYNSKIDSIVEFARSKIGTEYSTFEARQTKRKKLSKAEKPNRQFCTRFIAQCYKYANIEIVNNADYCSPEDIKISKNLFFVSKFLKKANSAEIKFATEKNNPIERQTEITNELFDKIRELTKKDIQTIEQLFQYVLDNREKEKDLIKIVLESEFLNMWKWDTERNPWYYDYQLFLKHIPKEKQIEVANLLSKTEKETRKRYNSMINACVHCYSFFEQEFYLIFLDLNEKLVELSKKRESIGNKILKEKST